MDKIKVFPLSDSQYTSQVYSGLFDLAAAREIDLEFTWSPQVSIRERGWGSKRNHRIVYMEIWENSNGPPCKVCYDMLDGPEIISIEGLEQCDVYFKRSYSQKCINSRSDTGWQLDHPEWRDKILPYGLNYPCSTKFEFSKLKRHLIFNYATGWYYQDPIGKLRLLAKRLIKGAPSAAAIYEVEPDEEAEPYILFQTRLFDPHRHPPTYFEENVNLNNFRVAVIQALKKAFGDKFIGGLIPNPYAVEHHSDLLTTQETSQQKYAELVRKCQVVVFTRGLRQSIGWRLPEYLAMSRCIVSEPLEYELPSPLQDGKNYLLFDSPDECVELCKRLLSDKSLVQDMRNDNFNYYMKYVRPASLIRNTIAAAKEKVREK